ncbi:hypothetical protein CAPTEDRAFT_201291 [Capitella teleta]|uniref:F5/8 type C domain-containing protein n=1 Tax=Capitella teleta TaxID=283909 RepID=R7UT67_CAPTE|nr:hypothetical protein CAPTEDRAFT_201291 [Capitella teleta]|eukprot:ELU09400.1 hypothetical protein CAPTEDRAFT_201291 [Capitella teleta]
MPTVGVEVPASCQCHGLEPVIAGVEDARLSASSSHRSHPAKASKKAGATWWPANSPESFNNAWIEVDLLTNRLLGGVATWGAISHQHYVKSYSIKYRSVGSDIWIDHTDIDGNATIFLGNDKRKQATVNEFTGGIYARYVRLYVLSYQVYPKLRWELFACNYYTQSVVDLHPGPFSASSDDITASCIKCIDTINNQIWIEWKGLVTYSNVANLVISGKSLICSHYYTTVGIAVDSMRCNAEYALCKIEGLGVDGSCHAACKLRDGQMGQPFNLLLMVTGEGAKVCDVSMGVGVLPVDRCDMNSTQFPAGRNILSDWDAFLHEISAH